jgi:DNA polymerase-4
MSGYQAKRLCPDLIFVPPRFEVYKSVSLQIREIFREYTDLIEPLSFDEAFLDVTVNKKNILHGMDVAREIMDRVYEKTDLTCSAGVSYCKFLAKIASGYKKPNGLTVIRPHRAEAFLEQLPVKAFFGVGKVTAAKMEKMGILDGGDLKQFTKIELAQRFGKMGNYYYDIVRGIDDRPVIANRVRKSLAVERTLEKDLSTFEEIAPELYHIIDKFFVRLTKVDNFGRTLTLKIKTSDFQTKTRSKSKEYFIKSKEEISEMAFTLLEENIHTFESIRLIGLTASNLEMEKEDVSDQQLELFDL